jgi:hypothetical protein
MVRKYETYTFSSAKFFADRGTEGVAQPLTERVNVGALQCTAMPKPDCDSTCGVSPTLAP